MDFTVNSTAIYDYFRSKARACDLPNCLHRLIDVVVACKYSELSNLFYDENRFVPKPIRIQILNNKIISINEMITKLSKDNRFFREQNVDFDKSDVDEPDDSPFSDIYMPEKYHAAMQQHVRSNCKLFNYEDDETEQEEYLIQNCMDVLTKEEVEEYKKYEISEKELMSVGRLYRRREFEYPLPKLELITDFLALVRFFDELIGSYLDVENGEEISLIDEKYYFNTTLSFKRVKELYNAINEYGIFREYTTIQEFSKAFGFGGSLFGSPPIKCKKVALMVYLINSLIEKQYITVGKWADKCKCIFGIKNASQIKGGYALDGVQFYTKPQDYEIIDNILDLI